MAKIFDENVWITLSILGVKIIRSLVLGVNRGRELFHIRAQRQQMKVRRKSLGRIIGSLSLDVEGSQELVFSKNFSLFRKFFFEEHPPGLPRGKGDVGARESFLPSPNCNTPVKDLTYKDLLTSTFTLASHERGIKTWCVPATYPECLLRQKASV
jgi:hypothetical protein